MTGAVATGNGLDQQVLSGAYAQHLWRMNDARYDAALTGWLAAVPGLLARLQAGAQVHEVGCGAGHALALLARSFPRSTFTGHDLDSAARRAAARSIEGLANAAVAGQPLTPTEGADVVLHWTPCTTWATPSAQSATGPPH